MSAPNLHPLVVHFPIVLLVVALALEAVGWARPAAAGRGLRAGAWGAAAIAAAAAFLTGRRAADQLVDLAPDAHAAIGAHADAAAWVVAAAMTAAALRALSLVRRGRAAAGPGVIAGVVALGAVAWAADRGGGLVFSHGVGVARPPAPAVAPPPPVLVPNTPAAAHETLVDDGKTATWVPRGAELGAEGAWPAEGVALRVDGTRELLLPGTFDDVQLNAWLDLRAFDGTVQLVHHVGADAAGALTWSASGGLRLETLGPSPALHDEVLTGLPNRVLAVNVTGTHQKGLVDGAVVAHGHAPPLPAGSVGLRLDGEGVVGLHRLEAIRLEQGAP